MHPVTIVILVMLGAIIASPLIVAMLVVLVILMLVGVFCMSFHHAIDQWWWRTKQWYDERWQNDPCYYETGWCGFIQIFEQTARTYLRGLHQDLDTILFLFCSPTIVIWFLLTVGTYVLIEPWFSFRDFLQTRLRKSLERSIG